MLATLTAWTLASLAGPSLLAEAEPPIRSLGDAVVAATALDTPSARFERLLPVVRSTCDLERATRDWPWPSAAAQAERLDRLEQLATWFFVGVVEREPAEVTLAPREGAAELFTVGFVRASSTDTFEFELAGSEPARIVRVSAPPAEGNELTGAGRSVLANGGVEALDAWLAVELVRPTESAAATIERLWEGLLATGRSGALDFDARFSELAPLIDSTHEFASIAVLRVGRSTYEALAPAEAHALVTTLRELSIATFASRFDDTAGLEFTVAGDEPGPRDTRTVRGSLRKRDGERIAFEYLMQRRGARWVVLNVTADGVSDLAVKKVEYAEILADGGIERLLAELEQQIAKQRE